MVVGERRHVFRTIICDTWHQIGLTYCMCLCIYRHTYMYTNTRMSAIIFAIVTIKIQSKLPFVNFRDNSIWYYHRAFPYFVGFHLNDMLQLVMKQCEICSVYIQSRYLKADRIVLTILWFHKFICVTNLSTLPHSSCGILPRICWQKQETENESNHHSAQEIFVFMPVIWLQHPLSLQNNIHVMNTAGLVMRSCVGVMKINYVNATIIVLCGRIFDGIW